MINESFFIDDIKITEITLPLKKPFEISEGICYSRKSLIIEINSGDYKGYGESAPFSKPFYSSETIKTSEIIIKEFLIPKISNTKIESIEALNIKLNKGVRGNNFAKAGIETAYWDLVAKANKISLQDLIKYKMKDFDVPDKYLRHKNHIRVGASVGIPKNKSLNLLGQEIKGLIDLGYNRIKLKIKPGWDIKPLDYVREIIGESFPLWVDANSSYDYKKHLNDIKLIDKYNCLFIEQPLHYNDIYSHKKLLDDIKTKICFDESIKSYMIAQNIVSEKIPSVWNIKIQRLGGLYNSIKVYKLAVENNVSVWGGTMPETGLGSYFMISLGSFNGFKYSSDINPSNRWFDSEDLVDIKMNSQGLIYLKETDGIGELNSDVLNNFTSRKIL